MNVSATMAQFMGLARNVSTKIKDKKLSDEEVREDFQDLMDILRDFGRHYIIHT